jgi:CheY-like chemotaxis protein
MDGLTCVRRIRELQQEGVIHGHVPVIAVTANVRSEQVAVALKAGMDDVINHSEYRSYVLVLRRRWAD